MTTEGDLEQIKRNYTKKEFDLVGRLGLEPRTDGL